MYIGSLFIPHAKAMVLVQPCEGAFHNPPASVLIRYRAVCCALQAERQDAAGTHSAPDVQNGKRLTGYVGNPEQHTWTCSRRPAPVERAPWLGFDTDAVVYRSTNPLLAAEIAFSCLHGDVPEKELDLIQFSTRSTTQRGTRTSQIMRCYLGKSEFCRVLLHDVPD